MLQYLQGHSRSDIKFAVSQCARFVHSPRCSHEIALERSSQYLKFTQDEQVCLTLSVAMHSVLPFQSLVHSVTKCIGMDSDNLTPRLKLQSGKTMLELYNLPTLSQAKSCLSPSTMPSNIIGSDCI
jgi:hypothetical protein